MDSENKLNLLNEQLKNWLDKKEKIPNYSECELIRNEIDRLENEIKILNSNY